MTTLECICQRLGPHTTDIAEFPITQGIPFSIIQRMTSIPSPCTPLCIKSSGHAALCTMGGIVARLAQEIIPISATLLRPSPDALEVVLP